VTVSVATVADWLGIATPVDPAPDYTRLNRLVSATVATARRRLCIYTPAADWVDPLVPETTDLPADVATWPTEVIQGCIMQAARLYRRKSTPEGIAEFPDSGLVLTVRRFDPDIEEALADFRRIGFA
jgi:hypothetical protein